MSSAKNSVPTSPVATFFRYATVLASLGAIVACQAIDGEDWEGQEGAIEAALMCQSKPEAQTYKMFDDSAMKLRLDEGLGVNAARAKPFDVMATEYKRVLGVSPASLDEAKAAFGAQPARWLVDHVHSGVSLTTAYSVGFDACSQAFANDSARAQAPTEDSASTFCKDLMTKAYDEDPTSEQVSVCVDLVMTKFASEPNAKSRWAAACASVLSSVQFLTF